MTLLAAIPQRSLAVGTGPVGLGLALRLLTFAAVAPKVSVMLDEYRVVIPAEDIPPTWDLRYIIEAMDKDGNGRVDPDLNHQTPYVVKLQR